MKTIFFLCIAIGVCACNNTTDKISEMETQLSIMKASFEKGDISRFQTASEKFSSLEDNIDRAEISISQNNAIDSLQGAYLALEAKKTTQGVFKKITNVVDGFINETIK